MIARVSEYKFRNSGPSSQISLSQKIEYILEDIFAGFNMIRKEVEVRNEEFSESDDEY